MWFFKRRALSIKSYLLSTYDIDGDRIVLQWLGEQNPAADNVTEEGHQRNLRTELAVGGGGGMSLHCPMLISSRCAFPMLNGNPRRVYKNKPRLNISTPLLNAIDRLGA